MSNEIDMRRKMAEISARYLARTVTEIVELQAMVARLPADGNAVLKDIELLAHRIRGSGAVFGFAKLSDAAGVIEMLAVDSEQSEYDGKQLAEQFTAHVQRLIAETDAASAAAAAQKS